MMEDVLNKRFSQMEGSYYQSKQEADKYIQQLQLQLREYEGVVHVLEIKLEDKVSKCQGFESMIVDREGRVGQYEIELEGKHQEVCCLQNKLESVNQDYLELQGLHDDMSSRYTVTSVELDRVQGLLAESEKNRRMMMQSDIYTDLANERMWREEAEEVAIRVVGERKKLLEAISNGDDSQIFHNEQRLRMEAEGTVTSLLKSNRRLGSLLSKAEKCLMSVFNGLEGINDKYIHSVCIQIQDMRKEILCYVDQNYVKESSPRSHIQRSE
jgi:hypothetical protein